MIDTGFAVIGDPDDCAAQMARLYTQSGGFGCFLNLAHPWAPWAQTKHSYELIAEYVIPKINKLNVNRIASEDWLRDNNVQFKGELTAAVGARIAQHAAERGAAKISPDYIAKFT